jgi:spore cortex biosynthesis protein YabQ
MDTSLILELHIFFTSIYGGLIAGSVYDIYRAIRYYSKPSKFISYLGDLIFWTIITSLFFYVLIKINWGEIRGYIILGFFIGVFTYAKVFSRFIYPVLIKVGGILYKIIIQIIAIILYPLKIFKRKSLPTLKKAKKIPIEVIRQIKKYKKIISTKK